MLKTTDNHIGQPANWQDDGYDDTPLPTSTHEVDYAGMGACLTVEYDKDDMLTPYRVTKIQLYIPHKVAVQLHASCDFADALVEAVSGSRDVDMNVLVIDSDVWVLGEKE